MKKRADKIKRLLAGGLLILFVGYVASTTLFYHTHIVNGIPVTHSHPYSQAPGTGNHTHSSAGFVTIAHLSLILMLAASFACMAQVFATVIHKRVPIRKLACPGREFTIPSLRAPPAR